MPYATYRSNKTIATATIRFIVTVAIVVYKGSKLVVYRMLTKFLRLEGDVKVSISYAKLEDDAKWDGLKGYLTNTNIPTSEVYAAYHNLWNVEYPYGIMNLLSVRTSSKNGRSLMPSTLAPILQTLSKSLALLMKSI